MAETNNSETSRKKSGGGKVLGIIIWAVCGFLIAIFSPLLSEFGTSEEIGLFITLAAFYLALIVQVIIHESGHLVCGLISGYKFNMFRIFSFGF